MGTPIVKVSDNSVVAQFTYDILGRRIQKTTSTTKINFIYAGDNAISETVTNLSTSGVIVTNRVFGIGTDNMLAYETDDTILGNVDSEEYAFCASKVAPSSADFTKYGWSAIVSRCNDLQNQYTTSARKMFFVQKDNLGSTLAITDASGSVVQSYAYDVYGKAYVKTGTGTYSALDSYAGNLHGNSRFFTGREYDGESGLYYLRARYYSADTGRFISRDTIGQVDNLNLYTYVQGNPLRFTDPLGLGSKPAIKVSAIGGFFRELIGFDTAYSPGEDDVNDPVVVEDYGTYGESAIFVGGFVGPGGKARRGEKGVKEIAEAVTENYKRFECKECARALMKEFEKAGIKSELLKIEGQTDNIVSDAFGIISKNGEHQAVKVGDVVYDNMNKVGVLYDDFMKDLGVGTWGSYLKK